MGKGNTIQYSCQDNPKNRRAWQAVVIRESQTTEAAEHTGMQDDINKDQRLIKVQQQGGGFNPQFDLSKYSNLVFINK